MTRMGAVAAAGLDGFDRHLLRLVQRDNRLTHAELGDRVGLSVSAVRRRLARLRADGIIQRDVSLLSREMGGVQFLVSVSFEWEDAAAIDAFRAALQSLEPVRQVYHVAGPVDYVLLVEGPDLAWFESWSAETFLAHPAVRRTDTQVVWSCQKFETAVPV